MAYTHPATASMLIPFMILEQAGRMLYRRCRHTCNCAYSVCTARTKCEQLVCAALLHYLPKPFLVAGCPFFAATTADSRKPLIFGTCMRTQRKTRQPIGGSSSLEAAKVLPVPLPAEGLVCIAVPAAPYSCKRHTSRLCGSTKYA